MCAEIAVISKSIVVADRIDGSIVNVAVGHGSSIILMMNYRLPATAAKAYAL